DDEQCPGGETCLGDDLSPAQPGTCGRSDSPGDDCDSFCLGAECIQASEAELGTCTAFAGDGEDCSEVPCRFAYVCNGSSECVPKGEPGDACASGDECKPQ